MDAQTINIQTKSSKDIREKMNKLIEQTKEIKQQYTKLLKRALNEASIGDGWDVYSVFSDKSIVENYELMQENAEELENALINNAIIEKNSIPIDEAHFPDANFRKFLLKQDFGKNGVVIPQDIRRIDCSWREIKDLTGIEYFTKLRELFCISNELTTLDTSKNPELKKLHCDGNKLTALNVTHNHKLEELDCSDNNIKALDIRSNHALKVLDCNDNNLTTIDISRNPAMEKFWCFDNKLTELHLNENRALKALECSKNPLESLNTSKNPALEILVCCDTNIKALDVSKNPKLKELRCNNSRCGIAVINISNNPALNCLIYDHGDKEPTIVKENLKATKKEQTTSNFSLSEAIADQLSAARAAISGSNPYSTETFEERVARINSKNKGNNTTQSAKQKESTKDKNSSLR